MKYVLQSVHICQNYCKNKCGNVIAFDAMTVLIGNQHPACKVSLKQSAKVSLETFTISPTNVGSKPGKWK